MEEKRKHPRMEAVIKVQDLATLRKRWTKNVSLGGCLMERTGETDFLPVACRLKLKLEIPGVNEPVMAFGVVKHRGTHRREYGIQFEEVDRKSLFYLERFMGIFLR